MSGPEPTVSVIVPYSPKYTSSAMLEQATRSIERQSVPTEVIVVREGENPAAARNIGLRRSETRYVAFLDADDLWTADKLSRQLERMRQTGAGLCLDASPMSRDDFFYELFVGDLNDVMSSILIDTEQVSPRFEERLERWEDHLFALEAAAAGVCFCQVTYIHRDHEASLTAGRSEPLHYLRQGKRYVSYAFDRVPETRPYTYVFYRRMYFAAGVYFHLDGSYRRALTYFLRSLQIGPSPYPMIGLVGSTIFLAGSVLVAAAKRVLARGS